MHFHTPLEDLVERALKEDIGLRDITTEATVPADARCRVRLVAKQHGIISGMNAFRMAFQLMDAGIEDWEAIDDGTPVTKGSIVARFVGHARAVLTAERTAMNFVQHLSGVATSTRQYVDALKGLTCRICDTRKTSPMLRELEKAAVQHGGGAPHRFNLFNGVLIKENHVTAAGGIAEAVHRAREACHHLMRIEVEVRDLAEFDMAMAAGADVIMLDNMPLEEMREAVARRNQAGRTVLEGSGNVTLKTVRAIAETGIDFVSVGSITHSAPVVDMSLLIDAPEMA